MSAQDVDRAARGDVPDPHRLVSTTADEPATVRAIGDIANFPDMAAQDASPAAGCCIPDLDRAIAARHGHVPAIGGIGQGIRLTIESDPMPALPRTHLPDLQEVGIIPITRGHSELAAIGTERDAVLVTMDSENPQEFGDSRATIHPSAASRESPCRLPNPQRVSLRRDRPRHRKLPSPFAAARSRVPSPGPTASIPRFAPPRIRLRRPR